MSTQIDAATNRTGRVKLEGTNLTTSLTVKDLRASADWYRDVFGFTVEQEMEREGQLRAVRLSAGNVRILLNQDDGAKGWDRIKGQGIALMITTEQSIDSIAESMKAGGATLLQEPADMPWGARVIQFLDPDGYKWTVSSPRRS